MLDVSKRRTIQMIGAVPLMLPAVSALASMKNATKPGQLPEAKPRSGMPLQIQIIDSTSIPDNDVLFRNNSEDTLLVTRFMPGYVYFNDKIMDLNGALSAKPMRLEPGQSRALNFVMWPVVNAGPTEYVWADQSVERLNDETSIITLGAFMADTSAVVYANTLIS